MTGVNYRDTNYNIYKEFSWWPAAKSELGGGGGGGGKWTRGAKTLYVYFQILLTLEWQNDVFVRTIYDWVGNHPPAPRINAPDGGTYNLKYSKNTPFLV